RLSTRTTRPKASRSRASASWIDVWPRDHERRHGLGLLPLAGEGWGEGPLPVLPPQAGEGTLRPERSKPRHRICVECIAMPQSRPPLPIASLMQPRSIALVGVSQRGGAGANILKSGERYGFAVPTWPVNPNYDQVG